MEFNVLTLFPGMFSSPFNYSILKKAQDKGIIRIIVYNIRDFTQDKHRIADDYPYGGGGGMVLKIEPIVKAIEFVQTRGPTEARVILMSPQGKLFCQKKAKELAKESRLIIICGHYEGIDERLSHYYVDEEISIGDYVLTGGELPAMVLIDTVARLAPQALGNEVSSSRDSFYHGLLDYPHYTRPADFCGRKVPEVLLSGNHQAIEKWRRAEALRRTWERRPELLKEAPFSMEDLELLSKISS
ncbi:MAG: tRNA (guanosine(37)-N1)-methyltransferase TrmD [Nitrospinae bacterium RIFCSPLOWO2_12_FULL_45_22]|nr:MAG: tRNA (guanosine(37)-N1)-methyltransferase TrmD [Nitrospinae bacterium RIFCSPLOWO2_12_FULL_45_22]